MYLPYWITLLRTITVRKDLHVHGIVMHIKLSEGWGREGSKLTDSAP